MPYNASTLIPGDSAPNVKLRCGNVRIAFWAWSLLCWLFILVFLCAMAAHRVNPDLAARARAVNDFFGKSTAFMTGPVIVLGTLLYFAWSRKTLTWFNGVLIDDQPVTVVSYQIRSFSPGMTLIYLRSASRLRVIYPVTSQDNKKFKNAEIVRRETAYNRTQVELLKSKLSASGATEERFWFLTKGVGISIVMLILVMIIALADT